MKPASHHRWLQFSFRGLLLVMAAIAMVIAFPVHRARQQRLAVEAIRQWGGRVAFESAGQVTRRQAQQGFRHWIQSQLGDEYFETVIYVSLSGADIRDDDLQLLLAFPELKALVVNNTPISDVGLSSILQLTNLERLDVRGTRITDAGLRHMDGLAALKTLDINDTPISDKGMEYLAHLPSLNSLGLAGSRVTAEGLSRLADQEQIVRLELSGLQVTDESVAGLRDFRN